MLSSGRLMTSSTAMLFRSIQRVARRKMRRCHVFALCDSLLNLSNSPMINSGGCFGKVGGHRGNNRHFCDDSVKDEVTEERTEDLLDLYNEPELKETYSVRDILYPNSQEPLMVRLKECSSLQDLFIFIKNHEMDHQLVSQAVLILWDFQRTYFKVNAMTVDDNVASFLEPYSILGCYIDEVVAHPDFRYLLQLVVQHMENMSLEALSTTLLYLNKMGVNLNEHVMQLLIQRIEGAVENNSESFPLTALSRFTVVFNNDRGLWALMTLQKLLPLIQNGIESCNNALDLRLVTISFSNAFYLAPESLQNLYRTKVKQLVQDGTLTNEHAKVIVKAANFLNHPAWSNENGCLIRNLLLLLKGSVHKLSPRELVVMHKVFLSHLEPADLLDEMQASAREFLSKMEDIEGHTTSPIVLYITTEILSCLVAFSSPSKKLALEELTRQHLKKPVESASLSSMFKILRHLKTSDVHLCDIFWSRMLQFLKNSASERTCNKLFRIGLRYMHFNNNLGGTYRHHEFEKQMIEWLWSEVEQGIAGLIPAQFAQITSFILAYGNIGQSRCIVSNKIIEYMLKKLQDMTLQFDISDCIFISRGLQIGASLGENKKYMSQKYLEIFRIVDRIMNDCTLELIKYKHLNLNDVNNLMKAYINRKGYTETEIFELLVHRYEQFVDQMDSRNVREASFNLLATGCLLPNIIDHMTQYVTKNGDHMLGETIERLLFLCYSLGYTPAQSPDFFEKAASSILRCKERMTGLILLQAGIALCFFGQLPQQLINYIFTVEFLERLDEEVRHCYAKDIYPMRVRHMMMMLNRAVCLDYPEADIPWFHQKYCEQIAALEPVKSTPFHNDVLRMLISLLGSKDLVYRNSYSPYSYQIDFQIFLNDKKQPVSMKQQTNANVSRFAVLLWTEDMYTKSVTQLCGEQQMKKRHLEMLGYKVIGISSLSWNSMYMAEPNAKVKYLEKHLFSTEVENAQFSYKL